MRFADRAEAGEALGAALSGRIPPDAIVLGIPRGGVVVARVVADRLGLPLDVVVPRKLGAPGNPELGVGAIAPGVRVVDADLVRRLGITDDYLEAEIRRQEAEIERRARAYRGDRGPLPVAGRTAVVVDDGVATGGTAVAALRWARANGAERVVLAVPVAPSQVLGRLAREADDVIALRTPQPFGSVGAWYDRFDQTPDREVVAALAGRVSGS